MSNIECPSCRGKGSISAFVDHEDARKSGYYEGIQCSRCKGSGLIDRKMEQWIKIGGTHRTWRVAQHESIRDCAARLGIGAAELSGMETGHTDPERLIADTPEILRDV